MKKIAVLVVLVLIAVLGIVTAVSAQNPTPPTTPPVPGQGYGPMMGRGGMMGGTAGAGYMHDYMQPVIAEKLGLTVEELNERHANGETFWQIAEEKGYSAEEAAQLMTDARAVALDQMVEEGVITQEQADWMKSRSQRMMGAGGCQGMGAGQGGFRGGRGGMMGGRWSTQDS